MNVTIDPGTIITAVLGALVSLQVRQVLRELRDQRRHLTHLQQWAARKFGYEPLPES